MLLSIHILDPVCDVNEFSYSDQASWTQGSGLDVYFQLIDLTQNLSRAGYSPAGLRFMPAVGSTLQVTLTNIDSSVQITRFATQPFSQDASIWKVTIFPTDKVYGTCDILLTLNQLGKLTTGKAVNVFSIQSNGTF